MLRGYRNEDGFYLRLALAVAGAALWIAFIWAMSAEHARGQIEAKYAARDYAESAEKKVAGDCARLSPLGGAKCIQEAIEASREDQRGERDLSAQESMARWTMAVGSLAFVGFFVSIVGVGLVYVTFKETRRAAELAGKSLIYQNRAWLHVAQIDLACFSNEAVVIVLRIENAGHSPAVCISAEGAIHARVHNPTDTNPDRRYLNIKADGLSGACGDIPAGRDGHLSIYCSPGQGNGAEVPRAVKANPDGLQADIELQWFDIFGTKSELLIQVLGPGSMEPEIAASKQGKLTPLHIANQRRIGGEEQTDYDLSPPGYERANRGSNHDSPPE